TGHGHLDASEQVPVQPEAGADAGRQGHEGVVRPAVVYRFGQVHGQVGDQIAQRREVVGREIVAGGQVRDEQVAGPISGGVGKGEAEAAAQDEFVPRVPPKLPCRASGSNSTKTYGSENSASWRLEQVPVNTEDPVKPYPRPLCRRLLYDPG